LPEVFNHGYEWYADAPCLGQAVKTAIPYFVSNGFIAKRILPINQIPIKTSKAL